MSMKRVFLWVGAAALLTALSLPSARAAGIKFLKSPKTAMAQASKQQKLVMVDLFTDWCGWCKKLDSDVYTNHKVADFAQKDFINLKVNAEKDPTAIGWVDKFKVDGFPTVLFLNAKGEEVYRIVGYAPASEFLKQMRIATTKVKRAHPRAA